jgi:hypothetical protein
VGYADTALTGNLIVNAPGAGGLVIVTWFSLTPVNITSGLLMNLKFITRGQTNISFDLSDPGYNELANSNGDPISTTVYNIGGVTPIGAVISNQPASSLTLNMAATGTLSVGAQYADTYQWQLSTDAGLNWSNLSNGAGYSGVGTASLSITAAASMNGHQYRVLVSGAGCPVLTSANSVLNIANRIVSGLVTYDNSPTAVIPFAVVQLKNTSTQQVISTTANAQGQYLFNAVFAGSYTIKSSTSLPWPRSNSTDALMVARHHSNIMFLSGLRLTAADVNASNSVNTSDALQILQRGIRIINQFAAGDWVSEEAGVSVGASAVSQNIGMLGYGDVNANAYPGNQRLSPPSFRLVEREAMLREEYFVAQVRSAEALTLGALTISLELPEGVRVVAVRRAGLSGGQLEFRQEGRLLNLGWYQVYGIEFAAGDVLFELITDSDLTQKPMGWNLLSGSEMADADGTIIGRGRLEVVLPILSSADLMSVGQVYPNPGQGNGHIELNLSRSSELTVRIWDATGKLVQSPSVYNLTHGSHSISIEGLSAGHYRVELNAKDTNSQQQIYRPMVVVR